MKSVGWNTHVKVMTVGMVCSPVLRDCLLMGQGSNDRIPTKAEISVKISASPVPLAYSAIMSTPTVHSRQEDETTGYSMREFCTTDICQG